MQSYTSTKRIVLILGFFSAMNVVQVQFKSKVVPSLVPNRALLVVVIEI